MGRSELFFAGATRSRAGEGYPRKQNRQTTKNDRLSYKNSPKMRLTTTTLALGMIFGLLLSPNLWLSSRAYPLTPVLSFLHPTPHPFDYLIYGVMLLLLA